MDHDVPDPHAPRPGDPRSRGPRPSPTWRDLVWLALTVGLSAVTIWQVVRLAVVATSDPQLQVSGAGLFLAFAITVAWLLIVWWVVMGSWRRSVWGCPFDHAEDAHPARRCPRHAAVRLPAPRARW